MTLNEAIKELAFAYNVTEGAVRGGDHTPSRQMLYVVMIDRAGWGVNKVARALNRNHATVIEGANQARMRLETKE